MFSFVGHPYINTLFIDAHLYFIKIIDSYIKETKRFISNRKKLL